MKVVLTKVPQDARVKSGQHIDKTLTELNTLQDAGYEFISATEHDAVEREKTVKAEAADRVKAVAEQSVKDAIARAKLREAIAAKDETAQTDYLNRLAALDYKPEAVGMIVNTIESLKASEAHIELQTRRTTSSGNVEVEVGETGFRETIKEYMAASLPFEKQLRNGGIVRATHNDPARLKQAVELSRERSRVGAKLVDMINRGADASVASLTSIIKAGDYADPGVGNPLGVLNTGLLLQQNLGFLSAQLALLDDITSDVSSQPALFNQVVRTRYQIVPKVQLKTTTNAWSTAQTGTDVDVNVVMDSHPGVPIAINNNILSSTPRQLFNEARQPMLYGLGQYIIAKLVQTIFAGSTRIANDGTTTSTVTFANANDYSFAGPVTLATFTADIPEKMDEMLIPGGDELPTDTELQRFLWVHGRIYAAAAADPTLMQIQAIQAIKGQSSNGNIVETGRYERLGNLKIRKSQLMIDNNTISGSGADATTNGITVTPGVYANSTYVGIGGTRNSLLFVSRVPQDYTKVLPDVPSTAAIELVTEPRTGITFLIVKYLDHAYEVANMRAQVMFGTAIGDERQAFKGKRTA